MSEYGHGIIKHNPSTPLFSHDSIKQKKEARKKLVAEIEQRRRENYIRFVQKKHRLYTDNDLL